MNNDISAAQALFNKQNKRRNKRKIGFIAAIAVIVLLAIGCIVALYTVKKNDNLLLAQNLISQFEINTTYREAEFKSDGDEDSDGVLNEQESRNSTNPQDADSDNDGLSDGDEASLGTDPLNPDTDGDSLLDGFELISGLDPTQTSTDNETPDRDRVVDISREYGELTLNVSGSANIADVSISELDLFGISSNTSITSKAYNLTSDYKFDSATLTFVVDTDKLAKSGADYSNLSVFKFDSSSQSFDKVESTSDSSAGTVSAKITQYGTYLVGVETTINDPATTRVAFLLDNSGSMYPVEQCSVSPENDVDFKRLDFAESLISKIDGDGEYEYSIAKFTGSYTLLQSFTQDKSKLNDALETIRTDDEVFSGSHIETALENCMSTFSNTNDEYSRNIIVLLSDGASDETNGKSVEQLAQIAENKNIIIMTVGLGQEADRQWLQQISSQTGGKYYSASDADALEGVYKQIVTTLNYDIVDYSDTGSSEQTMGYSLYNTGFDPIKNGFSIKNFRTSDTPSVDFGMAVMAREWYAGRMTLTLGSISPADESEQKYDADGYDFTGTELEEKLSENEQLGNIVPTMLTGQFSDVKQYLDYSSSGAILKIDDSLLSLAESQGWVMKKYTLDASNLNWQKVELLSLDISGSADKIEKASSAWELQFYKALYRLNALQWDDSEYTFDLFDGDEGFERLKDLLSKGEAVVTTIDGSHTVNAIGLIQDSSDHRKYVLEIYDNNYPGTTKKLYITRSVKGEFDIEDGKATLENVGYLYTCEYEGKQVGLKFSDVAVH